MTLFSSTPDQSADAWNEAANIDERAWELFLRVERCAGPLVARLGQAGIVVPPGSILTSAALADTKRSLSARALIASCARVADAGGYRLVLLKGAVAAEGGAAIHLMDLDILARPSETRAVAAAIAHETGSDRSGTPSVRHLSPVGAPDGLPVEIHTTIGNRWLPIGEHLWNDIRPIEGRTLVGRLGALDHARHILAHMVVDHVERRGRLRDTLLLAWALADLDPDARQKLRDSLPPSPYLGVLVDQLDFADRLRAGTPGPDPFEPAAFTYYWMRERGDPAIVRRSSIAADIYPTVHQSMAMLASGWPMLPAIRDSADEPTVAPSTFGPTRLLEGIDPRLGRLARVAMRLAI